MHKSAAYTSFTIDALIGRSVGPPSALALLQNISCALPSFGFRHIPFDAPRLLSSAPNSTATYLVDACCLSPASPVNHFLGSVSPPRHSAFKEEDDTWRQKSIERGLEGEEEKREERGGGGGGSDLHAFHVYNPLVGSILNNRRQCEEDEDDEEEGEEGLLSPEVAATSSFSEENRKSTPRPMNFGGDVYDRPPLFTFPAPPLSQHLPSVVTAAADRMVLSADIRVWSSSLDGQEARYLRRRPSSSRYPVISDRSPSTNVRSGSPRLFSNTLQRRRRQSTDDGQSILMQNMHGRRNQQLIIVVSVSGGSSLNLGFTITL